MEAQCNNTALPCHALPWCMALYCAVRVPQVMCFPSSHLGLIKGATANSKRLKRIHSLVDIDITMDQFEEWPYDLQQVRVNDGSAGWVNQATLPWSSCLHHDANTRSWGCAE